MTLPFVNSFPFLRVCMYRYDSLLTIIVWGIFSYPFAVAKTFFFTLNLVNAANAPEAAQEKIEGRGGVS